MAINCRVCSNPKNCNCFCDTCQMARSEDRGAYVIYERLLKLAYADNAGPVRRLARDLRVDALDHIYLMASVDLDECPDDFATEMVKYVCQEVLLEKAHGQ